MQKIFAYIGVMIVGVVIGCLLPDYHFRDEVKMLQRDTIVRFDTIRYSRLELVTNSNALKIPKIDVPKLAFLDVEKVDTIYKDNVMYLTYPRESYYTKAKDVEIWYSGIDSTIDSLNVVQKTQNIKETQQVKVARNSISLGIEASYLNTPSLPIYLEYGRMFHKNVEMYGQIAYDLQSRQWGVGIGVELKFGW
jgi:hypothetical protein